MLLFYQRCYFYSDFTSEKELDTELTFTQKLLVALSFLRVLNCLLKLPMLKAPDKQHEI